MTVALLEALTFGLGRLRAAAAEAGHRLCLLTADRRIYRHELGLLGDGVDVVDVDTRDVEACDRVLCGLPDLAGLVNSTDTWALPAAELAARRGLPALAPEVVRTLRDKGRVRRLLHDAGVGRATARAVAPTAAAVEEAVAAVGFPAILKDSSGTSSRSVWLVRDAGELARAAAAAPHAPLFGHLVAEPYFPGPVLSAETLTWGGCTRLLGVASHVHTPEPRRREEAVAFPLAFGTRDHAALEAWVGRVLAAVGFDRGVAHTEFVLTRTGPELVEVNGRIAGAVIGEMMCRALGTNVYEAVVATALGRRPALLDAGLMPRSGQAMAFLHPPAPGTLVGWTGLDRLATFPGDPEWYPTAAPGDAVVHLDDQRGSTGVLLADGPTAELALYNALAAAGTIGHAMARVPDEGA